MTEKKIVKNEVKDLCTKHSKTYAEVSRALDVHPTYVAKWNEVGVPPKFREKLLGFFEGTLLPSKKNKEPFMSEIRELCLKHKVTYRQVSDATGLAYATVSCWKDIPSKHREKVEAYFKSLSNETPGSASTDVPAIPAKTETPAVPASAPVKPVRKEKLTQLTDLRELLPEEKPFVVVIGKDYSVLDNILKNLL